MNKLTKRLLKVIRLLDAILNLMRYFYLGMTFALCAVSLHFMFTEHSIISTYLFIINFIMIFRWIDIIENKYESKFKNYFNK